MNNSKSSSVEKTVQKILTEEKPKTVRKLIQRTLELTEAEEKQVFQIIKDLERKNAIQLGSPKITRNLPKSFSEYLFKHHYFSTEFWVILSLCSLFFLTVLLIPETSPVLFIRVIIGGIFGIFVPGWVITNLIFPRLNETIDQYERILLSLGINLGIMIFSGLILNQIWVIETPSFVITIGSLTLFVLFSTILLRILIGTGRLDFDISLSRFNIFKKGERK
ncbi:MAG: hypothetical protein HeimAB125_05100 [Candidatus Heimdallarchaeota archaeon AB_125]|nr:MAG: hypothetical protein HeimAB125_05100 [Candidatus Heimdallarchaeota archaeon AB_125]